MSELAIISALIIGLSLGILGSGGAILTLPVLIYLMQYSEKAAVIGSLYIVGAIAFFTAIPHLINKRVSLQHLTYFAIPGLIVSYLGAIVGSISASWLQLSIFIVLMLLAAAKMLFAKPMSDEERNSNRMQLSLAGVAVGFATGFVGVGGGFLIVPALVFLGALPIKKAMATSIVIIFAQSAIGLISYSQHASAIFAELDWQSLTLVAAIGITGAYSGLFFSRYVNQNKLSKVFGYFLIIMSVFILTQKLL